MDNTVEWTLKALVARLQLPKTTVFRQVATLVDAGYLVQDPVRKSYKIGPRFLLLSSTIVGQTDLRTIARPELERLSAAVRETVNLSMMIGYDIFYLDKVETFRSVVCNTKIGSRVQAHATGAGKVMLAFQSGEAVDDYCRHLPSMQPLTEKTVRTEAELRHALEVARINGFAIDDGETEPGLTCIGVPIMGMDSAVLAAVSVSGPTYRMQKELSNMIREVKRTAYNISLLMGGLA